jgi:thioester reductase-like protein
MYRTGDRARFIENGQLEILGRTDFFVKIRGYSVVLGAVEAALLENVSISSCVVVADGDEGEEKHLVAYLVRAPAGDKDTRLKEWSIDTRTCFCPEVRRAVDGALPHYMVPSIFVEVETLPVSSVGAKLDRKALEVQSADRRAVLRSLQFSSETLVKHPAASQSASNRWKRIAKFLRVPPGSSKEDVEDAMVTLWEIVLGREPGTQDVNADFNDSGGHSLSAARLVALINRVFTSQLAAVQLMQGSTVAKFSQAVIASWNESPTNGSVIMIGGTTTEDQKVLQQVRDDAVLPEDVAPKADAPARGLHECKTILLTGATGYFGAHVLAEILRKYPSATVMCLVRSDEEAVQKNLERYKLVKNRFLSRTVAVKGDLSLPKLGMSQTDWDQTASTVDAVVHCGAAVSLTASYSMLAPANVNGTLEVIYLVCACKAGTPLVYVSSNGIFPRDKGADEVFLENDDIACLPDRLGAREGYGLSKWAAERLVVAAHKKGLPTMTVRFGNIGWQSTTGIGNSLDFQGMIMNGSRRLAARPKVKSWQFEVTPVDFAATALVALADKPTHVKDGAIFNCIQSKFVEAERIFEWIAGVDGLSISALSFADWKRKVEDDNSDDPASSALQALVLGLTEGEAYLSEIAHVECSKFDAAIAELDSPLTRLSPSDVEQYFKTFLSANQVAPLSSSVLTTALTTPVAVDPSTVSGYPVGPLAGKVAVVTGASSGIGRAIVIALVEAGCHVAMGARRLGELKKTQEAVSAKCPGSAAKLLSVRTDVTKLEDVAALVKATEGSLGPVDILVNCAGVMFFTLMKNVLFDQWETTVDVNCKGTMYGIGTVLPSMLERGKGHIVNITSDAGRKAFAGLGVYCGSKFFIEAMSQSLRAETASTGLRVTCIQPGNVATPLLATSTDPEGLSEYGAPTGAKVLEPVDIGRAVVYALTQPEWCAVNEILVEPREEPA